MRGFASISRFFCIVLFISTCLSQLAMGTGIIIDKNDTDLSGFSQAAFQKAKDQLHIAYGHTSHGSQLTEGMTGLVDFINGGGLGLSYPADFFAWNDGGTGDALDLADSPFSGAYDLGSPDRTAWETATRAYLNNSANSNVNVVMWSWCGQVSDATETDINQYLNLMDGLEYNYPNVRFVYMTGHVDGTRTTDNLFIRNKQIRDYCISNDKILYDFSDIESWDSNDCYFGDKLVNDDCSYDSDGDGANESNWAIEWQNIHTEGVDWYDCFLGRR